MQTYKIRRNFEGEMLYFDAKELIDLCIDHEILDGRKNKYVWVYHEADKKYPNMFPEGWYKDDYEKTIHAIMKDDNAVNLLLQELDKQSVTFTPSLDIRLLDETLLWNQNNKERESEE